MNTENHYQETDLGNISLNPRGEYSPEESYEYLDLVVFEGGSYVCLAENGATITGISPESGKTTQYWQVITIPGDLTPEYIAMHDRVVNLSEQVGADTEEVRTAEQNVSGMELNVTRIQEQTRQAAESAEQSKDSAAGYAASADASRRAAEESEQNINAHVTGFDIHVAEKTSEAESNIEAARIAANAAVVAQQKESIQEVKDQTAPYIDEKQKAAEQAIEKKAEEYDTSVDADIQAVKDAGNAQIQNVNSAGNTQVGNVNSAGANQIAAIESAGTTQKQEVNSAGAIQVQAVKDEGAAQVVNVQAAAQEIIGKVEQIGKNTQDVAGLKQDIKELSDKKITKFYASNLGNTTMNDSDDGKITDMIIFGKSIQDGTPTPDAPVEIQSVVNPAVKVNNGGYILNNIDYNRTIVPVWLDVGEYDIMTNSILSGINAFLSNAYSNNVTGSKLYNEGVSRGWKDVSYHIKNNKIYVSNSSYLYIAYNEPSRDGIPFYVFKKGGSNKSEPYTEQLVTLPYTLNAIPVSSGGNVTIDGQQYIADYVDVEKKQLMRMVGVIELDGSSDEMWIFASEKTLTIVFSIETINMKDNFPLISNIFINDNDKNNDIEKIVYNNKKIYVTINKSRLSENTNENFKEWLKSNHIKLFSVLATPTTIDLTDEEVQAFKELCTYYPTTNISIISDQLDGYTIFNYPLNMANGWNYVMQQIEETRPIIYDTEVQVLENRIDTAILMAMMEG